MSIRVERPFPGIITVTIDSPSTVNAITQKMLVQLARTFGELSEDETVRAVVITGSGDKAFSTGINLGDAEKVFKMDEHDRDKDVVGSGGPLPTQRRFERVVNSTWLQSFQNTLSINCLIRTQRTNAA